MTIVAEQSYYEPLCSRIKVFDLCLRFTPRSCAGRTLAQCVQKEMNGSTIPPILA